MIKEQKSDMKKAGKSRKKMMIMLLCVLLAITVSGCAKKASVRNTIEGNLKTYYEMTDGTWMCDDHLYKYRLEIHGRMPNAAEDSTFIYLSNIEEITFDQAYKASGISSNSDDNFLPEKAVLAEMN